MIIRLDFQYQMLDVWPLLIQSISFYGESMVLESKICLRNNYSTDGYLTVEDSLGFFLSKPAKERLWLGHGKNNFE